MDTEMIKDAAAVEPLFFEDDFKHITPKFSYSVNGKQIVFRAGTIIDADGYEVFRRTSKGGKYELLLSGMAQVLDCYMPDGRSYHYKMRAFHIESLSESREQLFGIKNKEISFSLRQNMIENGSAEVLQCNGTEKTKLIVLEAILMSEDDFRSYLHLIPKTNNRWWLRERRSVKGDKAYSCDYSESVRSVRPVLLLDGYIF